MVSRRGSSTEELAPAAEQMPEIHVTPLVAPELKAAGPNKEVAGFGPAISKRAQWKAPAIQAETKPLALTDEKLVYQLYAEEVAAEEVMAEEVVAEDITAEEARQGRNMATLEVLMEADGAAYM